MYNINYKVLRKNVGFYRMFLIVGIFFSILLIFAYAQDNTIPLLFFLILPGSFIAMAVINMKKQYARINQVKELNNRGVLYKNVPYYLERTGMKVNGVRIKKPVVTIYLQGGIPIRLEGDPRYDSASIQKNGLIDVILDPNDNSICFIDFNIDRIEGNRPEDYYKPPTQEQPEQYRYNYNDVKPL